MTLKIIQGDKKEGLAALCAAMDEEPKMLTEDDFNQALADILNAGGEKDIIYHQKLKEIVKIQIVKRED